VGIDWATGGGIPVSETNGQLRGVDAVIDKDLVSAILAQSVGAEMLIFLTDVKRVALNYGTPEQTNLETMSVAEAEGYLKSGQFPAGSMGPKVEGAVRFLKEGGRLAIITAPESLEEALAGEDGTRITT
jgi:carbamate kinase